VTVPYSITVTNTGNVGTDTAVTLSASTGRAGDTITLNYVLGASGVTNTLTFTGATGLSNLLTAGASTSQNYTVTASDAVSSVISITATFQHTSLTARTLSFTLGDQTKTYGVDTTFTNAATPSAGTGTVTYGSSNTGVATVNGSGVVTIGGVGSATITASIPADATYTSATASYTVTVNKGSQPAPAGIGKTDETATGANDGTITGVTTAMEYKLGTDVLYTPVTAMPITGLAPGTYQVRYAGTADYNAGADATVTILAYGVTPVAYTVTVNGSYAASSGAGSYASSATVTINAGSRSNYTFDGWTVNNGGVTLANANNATTTFTMPATGVTVTARWTSTGGGTTSTTHYTPNTSGAGSIPPISSPASTAGPGSEGGDGADQTGGDGTSEDGSTLIIPNEKLPYGSYDPADNPFDDVSTQDWFFNEVMFVYTNDLMKGTSTEQMVFSPNMSTTRGMIVTILYRVFGSPEVDGLPNPFEDVDDGDYYADAVKWAAANDIVFGYSEDVFGPNDNITREQLAAIILRYIDFCEIELPATRVYQKFADDEDISEYAKEAVMRLFTAGIISGKPGNIFDPGAEASRAEVAAILSKLLGELTGE